MPANTASLNNSQIAILLKTIFSGQSINIPVNFGATFQLTAGSGVNQYNNCYAATRSVTSGAADVIDLTDGTLAGPDGAVCIFADIIALCIIAATANAVNIVMGGGSGAMSSIFGATGTVTLPPGASNVTIYNAASAYSVSAHKLQVTTTGSASYNYLIVGH